MPLVLISLAAFIAGAVNAVAGGGTFLTFPTLTGIGGLSEKVANMTNTIGLWPGSAASVAAARREFRRLPRGIVAALGAVSIVGGGLGSWLLLKTSARDFRLAIPWLLAFATVVFAFSRPIARWAADRSAGPSRPGQGRRSRKWMLFVAVLQTAIAIYGGYFGAGTGVLMLAGFSFAGLDDIHQMNALKVLMATCINGIAAAIFLFQRVERVDWPTAAAMAAASVVGGSLGMIWGRRLHPARLRLFILAVGVGLTAYYFHKAYVAG